MFKDSFIKKNKGFTLVEMLVAIAVFMSVMVISVGALFTVINTNKKNEAIKTVVDNVSFALDSISRDMRTGTHYGCSADSNSFTQNTDCTSGGTGIVYTATPSLDALGNLVPGDVIYYKFVPSSMLSAGDGNIQMCDATKSNFNCAQTGAWQSLTAPTSTVNITSMKFYVYNSDPSIDAGTQPRVLITLQGSVESKIGNVTFALQTTISQRSR